MADAVVVGQFVGGARIRLRVKPGAHHDRLIGAFGDCLKVEVRAAPERGKANAAVSKLLAGVLDVTVSDVTVVSGNASRDKVVEVYGVAASSIIDALGRAGIAATER